MNRLLDLIVIGAGPAGMAAAATAAECGLSTLLIDEQAEPGGQIYRSIESVGERRPDDLALFGDDYASATISARRGTCSVPAGRRATSPRAGRCGGV